MATTKTTRKTSAKKASKKAARAPRGGALAKVERPVTLVTGGTGFLGSHLVRLLVEEGVKNLRVLSTSAPAWLGELGVEAVRGSITSPEDVRRAVEGVSEVYHLAGRVSSVVMASTSGTVAVTEQGDVVPDEDWPTPLDIISRWPYYASKVYQERVALQSFSGDGRRLVIMNPSLLLGPGDERLSSTRVVLDFLSRKIKAVPKGGLSFVDARDAALAFRAAMREGRHGERYLLGAANWTFDNFFGRLERITKTPAPFLSLPSKLTVAGARGLSALYRHWKLAPPVEPEEIEMAEYFWYLDDTKARSELGFAPRDPQETLLDTVTYVRENFLGAGAFQGAV